MFGVVAIVGTGMIGTSLGLALKRAGATRAIVGVDAARDAVRAARARGALDRVAASTAELGACDVIVVAVPVAALGGVLASLPPLNGAVVTDVGSVKGAVLEAARAALGAAAANFVPGHPVAGSHESGPAAATADRFDGCRVVLTPDEGTDDAALRRVEELWVAAGAGAVTTMDAAAHDRVFAYTSHLPHAVAYALIGGLLARTDADRLFAYTAGGLRDFTRIAASDPVMWRDVFLANAGRVLEAMDDFSAGLARLRGHIARGDGAALRDFLDAAAARRAVGYNDRSDSAKLHRALDED